MNKLKDWIFKKFYQEYFDCNVRYYEEKLNTCKLENYQQEKFINSIKNAFSHPNTSIIGFGTTKRNEEVFIVKSENKDKIYMKLYDVNHDFYTCSKIITTIYYSEECKYIGIDDIQVINIDSGEGSILMKYLIDYCKATDFAYITGFISPVDSDHFDRLQHFYEKFGFTFKLNENKKQGHIHLSLH